VHEAHAVAAAGSGKTAPSANTTTAMAHRHVKTRPAMSMAVVQNVVVFLVPAGAVAPSECGRARLVAPKNADSSSSRDSEYQGLGFILLTPIPPLARSLCGPRTSLRALGKLFSWG